MADLLSSRNLRRWLPWVLIVVGSLILPVVLPPFRLNLLGRFLSLGIVALGVDLIWGYTGMLSLGQGIFFSLGG
jgi:urea transport system permease protein